MKKVLRRIYNIVRSIVVTAILFVISVNVLLYFILSIPSVQNKIRQIACTELSQLLGTNVDIGEVSISPFNQLALHDVLLPDVNGDTVMYAGKVGVGFGYYSLIVRHKLVFTYAEIIGLDVNINKPTPDGELNIQFLIDALSPKDRNKPPTRYDLKINNIVIRRTNFRYDVISADTLPAGQFDANHVRIENLRADISLPRIKNNDYEVDLKRLSFREKNGFGMKNFSVVAVANDSHIKLSDMRIELPNTLLSPEDIEFNINGMSRISQNIADIPVNVAFANNYVTPSDFKSFAPVLEALDQPVNFTFAVDGKLNDLNLRVLELKAYDGRLRLDMSGRVENVATPDSLYFEVSHLHFSANDYVLPTILSGVGKASRETINILKNCGNIGVHGTLKGGLDKTNFTGVLNTSVGNVRLDGLFVNSRDGYVKSYAGEVETSGFDVGRLLSKEKLIGSLACNIDIHAHMIGSNLNGKVDGTFDHFDLKGYRYRDIVAKVELRDKRATGRIDINDKNGALTVDGTALLDDHNAVVDVAVSLKNADLAQLNITKRFPGKKLSLDLYAAIEGSNANDLTGIVSCGNLHYCDSVGNGMHMSQFTVEALNSDARVVNIASDYVNGTISGQYDVYTLARSVKSMLMRSFPTLLGDFDEDDIKLVKKGKSRKKRKKTGVEEQLPNNIYFNFNINDIDEVADMFNLPVKPLSPVTIDGFVSDSDHSLHLLVDAPYLQQKNKLIEGTRLQVDLNNRDNNLQVNAYSIVPIKNGKMALTMLANAVNDRVDSNLSWIVDNKKAFSGELSLSSAFERTAPDSISVCVDINPTKVIFNDTAWQVHPARVEMTPGRIVVDDIRATCDKQFLRINGSASSNPDDEIVVELNDMNLDYVFETLAINNVTFGGRATGQFYASDLFSGVPRVYTKGLNVKSLSYNDAVFGDAVILSEWKNDEKCVSINADVSQANGKKTLIDGRIYIAREALYFDFKPERVNVAFLKPFMKTFSSDIQGEASGHLVLAGTFHNVDLEGDVYVDSLRMKIDYTNVYYTARGSLKMRPGQISIDNAEVKDPFGNTANFSGKLEHNYFRDAFFNFQVTNARNLMGLNITQKMSPTWYGRVFCSGSTFIEGRPGYVNIDVNMSTSGDSNFTFVLSDTKVATEYDFITFVDRDKNASDEDDNDTRPEKVKAFLRRSEAESSGMTSQFGINLMLEVTPQAQFNLVMNPAGGDRIRAVGNGNLRIGYDSADGELSMFGTYTLARGNYNFTLQDIIIKDFTIREGSSITFNGNPMSATADIEAIYSLHANLADLDESFATDGELNRTNVPVNALLRLQGDISAPDISFDLEFPTLTSDVYRKVMSIVSTEDMMNRQIIYLLALNSFYTPDYMQDNSRTNELTSVASSTISSQLSNILGQMSENWSISPNFRSENGDFSDIEVELALSSQLLNNRLLFNGNFGYRDNALNTRNSNFIGDFDIEYLLTKNGNIRLKAYNHYNDQNYYVRSALTTQGVGVVFKRDFDNLAEFFGRKKSRKNESVAVDTIPANTVPADTVPADTIAKEILPVNREGDKE